MSTTQLPLDVIAPSRSNPRTAMDAHALGELQASIEKVGILQPVLVRPLEAKRKNGVTHEIVAGHRRVAAARGAGLKTIPVTVRALTDLEVLEIQLIENLQRSDLHPLEEAEGYQALMTQARFTVTQVAARIGRSVAYVYDRVKLLALTGPAQKVFREGAITAGHAILLARLTPKDQARALEFSDRGVGGVFQEEHTLWDPGAPDRDPPERKKARSVRELQAWIDEYVRFNPKEPDPMLFPETAATLAGATKIVPITHLHHVAEAARDGRTWGPQSWKRADGAEKSKACERAVTGFVAIGPRRGEAFPVCVDKERCAIHWPPAKKQARREAVGRAAGAQKRQQDRWEKQRLALQERKARWDAATPAVLRACEAAIRKASTRATGPLAAILEAAVHAEGTNPIPRGVRAEDLLRHLAFRHVAAEARGLRGAETVPRLAGKLGVNVKRIVAQTAALQTSGAAAAKPAAARRPAGKAAR